MIEIKISMLSYYKIKSRKISRKDKMKEMYNHTSLTDIWVCKEKDQSSNRYILHYLASIFWDPSVKQIVIMIETFATPFHSMKHLAYKAWWKFRSIKTSLYAKYFNSNYFQNFKPITIKEILSWLEFEGM